MREFCAGGPSPRKLLQGWHVKAGGLGVRVSTYLRQLVWVQVLGLGAGVGSTPNCYLNPNPNPLRGKSLQPLRAGARRASRRTCGGWRRCTSRSAWRCSSCRTRRRPCTTRRCGRGPNPAARVSGTQPLCHALWHTLQAGAQRMSNDGKYGKMCQVRLDTDVGLTQTNCSALSDGFKGLMCLTKMR